LLKMPRFEIQVIEAQGVPANDLNGKSDPYVEVCSAAGRQKTEVVKNTLNPVWRETKVVEVTNPMADAIGFLVYDWDRMSANDIIAYGFISMLGLPADGMPLDCWVDLYKKNKKDGKKSKKDKKNAKSGKPPKPPTPGGRIHLIVRALDVPAMPAAAPMPVQPMPGQPMPGQPMPGQPMMAPMPGQPMPGQPMMAPMPGQPMMAPMPGQPMPGQPMMAPMPGQPMMAPAMRPLMVPTPYNGAVPQGFMNKCGFLRPKKTDAEVAGHAAGKGAKKTLKFLGKLLT